MLVNGRSLESRQLEVDLWLSGWLLEQEMIVVQMLARGCNVLGVGRDGLSLGEDLAVQRSREQLDPDRVRTRVRVVWRRMGEASKGKSACLHRSSGEDVQRGLGGELDARPLPSSMPETAPLTIRHERLAPKTEHGSLVSLVLELALDLCPGLGSLCLDWLRWRTRR